MRCVAPCGADCLLIHLGAERNEMQGRNLTRNTVAVIVLSLALGTTVAAQGVYRDLQPGSFLVFPAFDITEDFITQLRITNTDPATSVQIQLNFVCPGSKQDLFCDALDRHLTLTPSGTAVIDVESSHPPCHRGYVTAFAENDLHQAISFNALIGSYHITRTNRRYYDEAEQAIAIQSVKPFQEVLGTSGALQFGADPDPATQDYAALGTHLFTGFQAVDGRQELYGSELILLSLSTIVGADNPASLVVIDFWNEDEVAFSASWEFVCWTQVRVDAIDLNFLESNLGTPYGSMTIMPVPNCPVPGGCPPLIPFEPAVLGAIRGLGLTSKSVRNLYHDDLPRSGLYIAR